MLHVEMAGVAWRGARRGVSVWAGGEVCSPAHHTSLLSAVIAAASTSDREGGGGTPQSVLSGSNCNGLLCVFTGVSEAAIHPVQRSAAGAGGRAAVL